MQAASSSGAESPAAALLRFIQAHPNDPGVLRREASTAGVANAAFGGATSGSGARQSRDGKNSPAVDATAPLDFSDWSSWIVTLDGTFSAAAAATTASAEASIAAANGHAGATASATAGASVGARLPEPGTGPLLPNPRRRNGRARIADAHSSTTTAAGSLQPFKRGRGPNIVRLPGSNAPQVSGARAVDSTAVQGGAALDASASGQASSFSSAIEGSEMAAETGNEELLASEEDLTAEDSLWQLGARRRRDRTSAVR